jgi:hypothetical protein
MVQNHSWKTTQLRVENWAPTTSTFRDEIYLLTNDCVQHRPELGLVGTPTKLLGSISCQVLVSAARCQFLLPGGSIGSGYVLQLLINEKEQYC